MAVRGAGGVHPIGDFVESVGVKVAVGSSVISRCMSQHRLDDLHVRDAIASDAAVCRRPGVPVSPSPRRQS